MLPKRNKRAKNEVRHINVFGKCIYLCGQNPHFSVYRGIGMVKVITIMDDIYAELYQLKRSKNMSFSEILRYLVKQRRDENRSIIALAGSINEMDVDRRAMEKVRRVYAWNR
jgi:predicted CopG family antitoxin